MVYTFLFVLKTEVLELEYYLKPLESRKTVEILQPVNGSYVKQNVKLLIDVAKLRQIIKTVTTELFISSGTAEEKRTPARVNRGYNLNLN
ncbi:MAG: hypothetical protein ACOC10_06785 [Bacteroidota bacterium]